MLNRIRAKVEGFITGLAMPLAKAGFRPELLSLMGLAAAVLSALAYMGWGGLNLYTASTFVILSGFFDMVDGSVARITGREGSLGSFLDSTIDRFSDAAIIGGLIISGRATMFPGLLALVGSLLTSYVRAKGESLGLKMSGIGLIERGERIMIIAVAGFLNAVEAGVWVLAALSLITVVQRIVYVCRRLRQA